ncbi:Uncharacterised protein [Streptococcus pneumoniae]|nr:Uncharacterised protein [Streptococcus pneumoniae]
MGIPYKSYTSTRAARRSSATSCSRWWSHGICSRLSCRIYLILSCLLLFSRQLVVCFDVIFLSRSFRINVIFSCISCIWNCIISYLLFCTIILIGYNQVDLMSSKSFWIIFSLFQCYGFLISYFYCIKQILGCWISFSRFSNFINSNIMSKCCNQCQHLYTLGITLPCCRNCCYCSVAMY